MTPDQFISKWIGKEADWDGAYAGQCVDLFRYYCHEVLGIKQPAGVWGAANFWTNFETDPVLVNNFDKVLDTSDFTPKKGDVMIWNFDAGKGYGHIAICTGENSGLQYFKSFDQNWSKISYCEIVNHNYKNVYGVLRQKVNMPNLNDEIIGKASQRDKVVNHYKFEIGTAKDDELLIKVKDLIKQSDDKAKDCNKKLSDIVENTTKEVVEEINKAFENPQKEPKVATIKNAIGGLRGLITIKEGELEAKQKELDECKNLPTDPVGYSSGEVGKELMRWLVVGLIPATLTYLGTIQAEWAIVATVALKLIDKSIHEYGKAIDKDWLIKGLTRF